MNFITGEAGGAAGAAGSDGAAGAAGSDGATGPAGSDGAAGADANPFNPRITMLGSPNRGLKQSNAANYVDDGATAVNSSGTENLTSAITTTGAVGTALGVYTITYTVVDSFDRSSSIDRKVLIYQ
jgi:collagen type I/II/III/V/XI/XXIV/XXVII alpha